MRLGVERVRERAIRERTIHPGARVLRSRAYPGPPYRRCLWGTGPATHAKRFGMGERLTYASVCVTHRTSRAIQCTQASIYIVRIGSRRRSCILCKLFGSHPSHFHFPRPLSPSPSPWHGPQFQVLRVEMFRFSSSKISIYEFPFLPEPTTRAVCREGGPEIEFATAGT